MDIHIITPDKELYNGTGRLISLCGTEGSFALMDNHAPIISTLKKGEIKIINSQEKETKLSIESGVVEMQKNKVIVLAEPVKEVK